MEWWDNIWLNEVSFLSRNPDFLSRNPDFLLKNVDFIIEPGIRDALFVPLRWCDFSPFFTVLSSFFTVFHNVLL